MRHSAWLVATVLAAAPAFAQGGVAVPVGQNLRDRPELAGDVVLDIDAAGTYLLDGQAVGAAQLAERLAPLMRRIRDQVVYIRADARLSAAAFDAATATIAHGGACVAALVGAQERGTISSVRGNAGQDAGNVRRAIDLQLPLPSPRPTGTPNARQRASAVVLEVLPGQAYRINSQTVAAAGLERRLLEIFNPRPIKVLFVRADAGASYQDLFHATDAARYAGVVDVVAAPPELAVGSKLPDIDLTMRVTPRDDSIAERIPGNVGRCRRGDLYLGEGLSAPGVPASGERVYFEFQVENRATLLPGSHPPDYPAMMRASHTNGEVLAQFIVDTNGLVRTDAFRAIKSTNVLFTQAVKDGLQTMRFAPATIAGRRVPQLVQQPFYFTFTPE